MAKKDLKVGIIGCGRVTEMRHLPVLLEIPGVEVVALADSDSGRLEIVGRKFGISLRFGEFEQLVAQPDLDIVAVCVPANYHAEVAIAALDKGKHLFIEKPLALTLDDCDAIIEKVRPGQHAIVGFNLRHHRLVQQAQRLIGEGITGPIETIRSIHTSFHDSVPTWRERRQTGGGVLYEQAVHHIDLWRLLLCSEVEKVYAVTRSHEWEDLSATIIAQMEDGVVISAVFCEQTSAANEIEIIGRQGKLFISGYRFDGLRFKPFSGLPGSFLSRLQEITRTLKHVPDAISSIHRGGEHHSTFREEWRHFCQVVRGEAEPKCTLEDGRRAVQVVLAAAESDRIGRPV
ncbi:MAG: hypothetical protein BBJ57_11460, partial [Desulfobacterales bacterium PC51MH44]